jgi:hypothetical protein
LEFLSTSFYATGNERMGEELGAISEAIGDANKAMNDATNMQVSERLSDAQQASANVLNAALSGILVGSDNPKEM